MKTKNMANRSEKKTTVISPYFRYLELNNQGQVHRFELHQDTHRLGRDPAWADLVVPPDWCVISKQQAIFRKEGDDYRIYDGDEQHHPSTNGIWLNHRRIKASQGYLQENGVQLEIGQDHKNYILLTYYNVIAGQPRVMPSKQRLSLQGLQHWPVELGREPKQSYSSMELDAPTVSRLHATIYPNSQGGYFLEDCHSSNGTFLNSRRLRQPVSLHDGDKIQIGPFTLVFRHQALELFDRGNQIRLDAHRLLRKVKERERGEKIILNQVSLPIEPGQLVALVGGSGTGKSTLLKALLGIEPINEGRVLLNGNDLHRNFDTYRAQIGYVPQDDIVHQDLTVEEVLTYTCQLRLPPETPFNPIVEETLRQVKLDSVKTSLVSDLSGGQRKRVSIAVELLADPKLFFLDEPTSGLDPGLDKEIVQLLRQLANQGRTIVLVTHATANIEACDRIAFLGRGGKLCYFGPPTEAMDFFEMPSQDLKYFADIYLKLEQGNNSAEVERNVRGWREKFLNNSPPYQTYIKEVLGVDSPSQSVASQQHSSRSPAKRKVIPLLRQGLVLSKRYLKLIWRDRLSLALALLTAPVGIILIALVVKDQTPLAAYNAGLALRVLFIFICAAIFVGLLSSVEEIVKESSIYARERLINLSTLSYLGSKLLIRSGLAVLQTFLIVLVILLGFKSPESELIPWPLGVSITTFLTIIATICLGLMVSAWVKNETEANNSLSLILLPQIILSGVLFKSEGFFAKVSWLTISRWSVGAYGTLVNVKNMVSIQEELPFDPEVYAATWQNLTSNWMLLCLHGLVYLGLAFWIQRKRYRR